MTSLPLAHPLARALSPFFRGQAGVLPATEVRLERLRASRPVFRFSRPGARAAVGKFYQVHGPGAANLSLLREFQRYCQAPALGLKPGRHLPRLWGCQPRLGLGLLVEAVPGPDLDYFLEQACFSDNGGPLLTALSHLARLLAYFHTRPVAIGPVALTPALNYLEKLRRQLTGQGLLSPGDDARLVQEARAWSKIFASFPDQSVLIHGDATPTNFLFPNRRAVALDLERMKVADRLFDLSWVAGEIKHAWGWRNGNLQGGEEVIGHFLQAYLAALEAGPETACRLFLLNPFYMALAELRICRNDYLDWDYRRCLLDEALACLAGGRRLAT